MISSRKIAIIGVGYVGASIAYSLIIKGLAHEIVLIDSDKLKCVAESNDIRHGIPYMGSSNIYAGEYSDIKDCDMIIITAGRNRRANENRLDMAVDNVKTSQEIANEMVKYYNQGVVLVVTNPVDIITHKLTMWLNLPRGTVFGTGCLLDSSRFVNTLSDYVKLRSEIISATVIGEHGDRQVALWSKVQIAGTAIDEYCKIINLEFNADTRKSIESKVIRMGTEIIKGKNRTHYGIATCVCYIADAIINRRDTIVSVTSTLHGEYGINNVALSLPCIIGSHGIKRVLTDTLGNSEFDKLKETEIFLKECLYQV